MKFLKISNIKLNMNADEKEAYEKAIRIAGINREDVISQKIVRYSIDARDKNEIHKIYTVGINVNDYNKSRKNVTVLSKEATYEFSPSGKESLQHRPVVVGFGPAGMFCAYMLAKYGYQPIIIERGSKMDERVKKVEQFWQKGSLDINCNVQFGEGGAGTFSDGKLNTGIKDKRNRIGLVLDTFVRFGADWNITYDAKPHIGTDVLADIVVNMRQYIERKGGEFYFDTTLLEINREENQLVSLQLSNKMTLKTGHCILAIGHSARDTFEMLYRNHFAMEAKPFAVGVRVEHKQSMINKSQYGFSDNRLGAAPYKLAYKSSQGRGVYSFCMCPGGYVVNASSEQEMLAVNGMSYHDRAGRNANSAIVVTVLPSDFESTHPLSGIAFQRTLERKAYLAGRGNIPVQKLEDFREKRISKQFESIVPQTKGLYTFADINEILPADLCDAIKEAMDYFGTKITGFNHNDVILSAVESRTSSPVRILRDTSLQASIPGVYPAGEGAGYAGGITSAAIDGIKIFETIAEKYKPFSHIG